MAHSVMYTASVPVFKQILTSLANILAKAEAHAEAKKIDPNAYLQARLFPDMFALTKQVQVAADFAKGVCARLAGVEVPSMPDDEVTFGQLQERIQKVIQFIESLDPAAFDQAATREIVVQPGTPRERRFTGHAYLFHYGLAHFYFHCTTAYNLLRHGGIDIGKKDFIGTF